MGKTNITGPPPFLLILLMLIMLIMLVLMSIMVITVRLVLMLMTPHSFQFFSPNKQHSL